MREEARVPVSIAGKTGRIQAGVMEWMGRCAPVKRTKYCAMAAMIDTAAYIQKHTRKAVASQDPVAGIPYAVELAISVATLSRKQGKKRLSVGCIKLFPNAPGVVVNRRTRPDTIAAKSTIVRIK
jgi:hypothetical protein